MRRSPFVPGVLIIFLSCGLTSAWPAVLVQKELFQIPFGSHRDQLSARVEKGNFTFPGQFSMDGAGQFYIYDINNHRIACFSPEGSYRMSFKYSNAAQQVFARPDARQNLWLLVSEPREGVFYGVYDSRGKQLRSGVFVRYNRFRLRVDDDYALRIVLLSGQEPAVSSQTYVLDEEALLMKKDLSSLPPETHHEVRRRNRVYSVDQMPSQDPHRAVAQISDEARRPIAKIDGTVVYVTGRGEIYTRVGKRQLNLYEADGTLIGRVRLKGLSSACAAIRFDTEGNIYVLDGIPDKTDADLRQQTPPPDPGVDFEDLHYTPAMKGMRLLKWERQSLR